jgi:hypothetical protein
MDRLTEGVLRRQVQRLKALPRGEERPWGEGKEPGLRDELLRSLWNQAHSDEHAKRIIDAVIDKSKTFCPTPAELTEIASMVSPDPQAAEKRASCEGCGGVGYTVERRKARALPGLPEREYDYALPCVCNAAHPVLTGGRK